MFDLQNRNISFFCPLRNNCSSVNVMLTVSQLSLQYLKVFQDIFKSPGSGQTILASSLVFAVLPSAVLPQSLCRRGPKTWEMKQGQEPSSSVSPQFLLLCSPQMVRKKPYLSFSVVWLLLWPCFLQLTLQCKKWRFAIQCIPLIVFDILDVNGIALGVASIRLTWFHQFSCDFTPFISAGNSDKFKYSILRRLPDLAFLQMAFISLFQVISFTSPPPPCPVRFYLPPSHCIQYLSLLTTQRLPTSPSLQS